MPGPSTSSIHGQRDSAYRSVIYPIYPSAAFAVENNEAYARLNDYGNDEYFYTRYDNPTLRQVSEKLARLEGAQEGLLFASGMTAITTSLLALLQSGDTIASARNIYGGTYKFLRDYAPRYGIHVIFLDTEQLYMVDKYAPTAKVVYFETPINPRADCVAIRPVVAAARRIGATIILDNTFATPINQQPIAMGVDLVIHSTTKFLGGHNDITGGAVLGARSIIETLFEARKIFGGIPSPYEAYLLDRSLKTLEIRMARHNDNALLLAQFFEAEAKVKRVFYPGLASSPDYAIAREQMSGFGGMLCIELADMDSAVRFVNALKLAQNVGHLGGAETMVAMPRFTSHAALNDDELQAAGLSPAMVRISVGLENVDDLLDDFRSALAAV